MILVKRWILRDYRNRLFYLNTEIKKNILKSLLVSSYDYKFKLFWFKCLWKFGKFNSISFCRNSCIYSFKSRSVFRRFKLGRHLCKKFASNGLIVGLRRASF